MSEGITIARVYFGCVIHCFHCRSSSLNNTTRRHECVPQRMFAWLTINTKLRVPYRTDSDTVTVRSSNANKGIIHIFNIHLTVSRMIHGPCKQVSVMRSQFAHPERITCPERLLSEWVDVTLSGSASSQ